MTFNSVPGHEHPHSIAMNSVRNTSGAELPTSDHDLNDNDVQFILRHNKKMAKKHSFGE